MDPHSRLKKLAALAAIDPKGLPQALRSVCPDWIPSNGDPGEPNREFTRTGGEHWRAVSVLVSNILRRTSIDARDIASLAELFVPDAEPGSVSGPMDETAEQILATIRRWQDPGTWQTVNTSAELTSQFDAEANKLGGDARFLLDRGDTEQASELKSEADHLRHCAATIGQQRSELIRGLFDVEHWIRNHRPDLLEFVPTAQFDGDHSESIRDLKRLESRLSVPAAAEPTTPEPAHKNEFADATATVPEAYKEHGRECGPLTGTKTALARVVSGNPKAKPEDLKRYHGRKVFVRQIQPRKVEVFFRSFKERDAAKDRLTPANSE